MAPALTSEEQAMLRGANGRAKQLALQYIVDYATALGAERLVEISKAQIFVGAHHYLRTIPSEDIDEVISAMYFNTPERVVLDRFGCFTQSDVGPLDPERWRQLGISQVQANRDKAYRERLARAGAAQGGSCAAYLVGFVPLMGEHYVSTELHALLFMNAVWGARANADSIEASVCAAVCGRTAWWGNHIAENRRGTHLVEVEAKPETVWDWDMLGYAIGQRVPSGGIPVITGDFRAPDVERLKSCFAAMATSGSAEMCHIVGLTPEAPAREAAFGGKAPVDSITITRADLNAAHALVSQHGRGKVGYVSLGCPHYSLKQIQEVARWAEGKTIHPDVIFHVWTAPATRDNAARSGFVDMIAAAGGHVMTTTCPLVSQAIPDVGAIAFDSLKQAKYLASCTQAKIFAGPLEQCLDTALTGVWRGLMT